MTALPRAPRSCERWVVRSGPDQRNGGRLGGLSSSAYSTRTAKAGQVQTGVYAVAGAATNGWMATAAQYATSDLAWSYGSWAVKAPASSSARNALQTGPKAGGERP